MLCAKAPLLNWDSGDLYFGDGMIQNQTCITFPLPELREASAAAPADRGLSLAWEETLTLSSDL